VTLLLWPVMGLLTAPFRLFGIVRVEGVLALLATTLTRPAQVLGWCPAVSAGLTGEGGGYALSVPGKLTARRPSSRARVSISLSVQRSPNRLVACCASVFEPSLARRRPAAVSTT